MVFYFRFKPQFPNVTLAGFSEENIKGTQKYSTLLLEKLEIENFKVLLTLPFLDKVCCQFLLENCIFTSDFVLMH